MTARRPDMPLLAVVLVGAVFAIDLLWSLIEGSTDKLSFGLFDEPAHLATCIVALLAAIAVAGARPPLRFVAAALVASVAIDLDHLPGFLGSHLLTGNLPRPYTHSALLVAALAVAALVLRRREQRQVVLGVAFGVSAHLLRDLATGPGVSLLWPLDDAAVTVPYAAYAVELLAMVAVLSLNARRARVRGPAYRRRGVAILPSAGQPGGS